MVEILQGDCLKSLKKLESKSINTCVTSPPYFGLRNYGADGQLGLEETPEEFVENLVKVFREVKRVLRDDGTVWLNLGDSYAMSSMRGKNSEFKSISQSKSGIVNVKKNIPHGLKAKDLIGIPWRVAFALQKDGWYLRQDIIWHKPNPMPESVRDRCTKSHEYIFLLSKNNKYYYDNESIKEDTVTKVTGNIRFGGNKYGDSTDIKHATKSGNIYQPTKKRNKRTVWTVTTKPFKGAHFAVFPMDLIEPCVLAGCPEGGTVLDPFGGSGTTGLVAQNNNRNAILLELNPEYIEIAKSRIVA